MLGISWYTLKQRFSSTHSGDVSMEPLVSDIVAGFLNWIEPPPPSGTAVVGSGPSNCNFPNTQLNVNQVNLSLHRRQQPFGEFRVGNQPVYSEAEIHLLPQRRWRQHLATCVRHRRSIPGHDRTAPVWHYSCQIRTLKLQLSQ